MSQLQRSSYGGKGSKKGEKLNSQIRHLESQDRRVIHKARVLNYENLSPLCEIRTDKSP